MDNEDMEPVVVVTDGDLWWSGGGSSGCSGGASGHFEGLFSVRHFEGREDGRFVLSFRLVRPSGIAHLPSNHTSASPYSIKSTSESTWKPTVKTPKSPKSSNSSPVKDDFELSECEWSFSSFKSTFKPTYKSILELTAKTSKSPRS